MLSILQTWLILYFWFEYLWGYFSIIWSFWSLNSFFLYIFFLLSFLIIKHRQYKLLYYLCSKLRSYLIYRNLSWFFCQNWTNLRRSSKGCCVVYYYLHVLVRFCIFHCLKNIWWVSWDCSRDDSKSASPGLNQTWRNFCSSVSWIVNCRLVFNFLIKEWSWVKWIFFCDLVIFWLYWFLIKSSSSRRLNSNLHSSV